MKLRSGFLLTLLAVLLSSCLEQDGSEFRITTFTFDFDKSEEEFQYGFSDYNVSASDSAYRFQYSYTRPPGSSKKAIMVSGVNHSDDLFMYLKRKLTGLDPNTEYTATVEVEFFSEAKKGTSAGDNVFIKAGATTTEPKTLIDTDYHVMNIDIGHQSQDGDNMIVIGDISVPQSSEGWVPVTRTNSPYNNPDYDKRIVVTTNGDGEAWLIVGSDSGYEGQTTLYYSRILVVLSQAK